MLWVHLEPSSITLAVNYIMPFNSGTPKIDGYYNSSILATAKNSAGISQMRRLNSGWGQACDSTLITETAEVSIQPESRKYCTYILFTALSPKENQEMKQNLTLQIQSRLRRIPPSKTQTLNLQVIIYTIDKWLNSSFSICKTNRKVFVLFLNAAQYNGYKQKKNEDIRSRSMITID